MKITGGEACGRPIAVPAIHGVRPTGSKMRQSLFNILGKKVRDAEVLDLFAGSGLMGFEALSRGGKSVVFVERNSFCVHCIEISAQKLNYQNKVKIIEADFRKAINSLLHQHFDIIFADPPYKSDYCYSVLKLVSQEKLLKPKGTLIIEHGHAVAFDEEQIELKLLERRPYGQSAFSFFAVGHRG